MKKIVTLLIIAALAAALCISLVACDDSGSGKRPGGGGSFNPGGNGNFGELDTSEEIYGFSAASAGMLISAMNDGSAASLATSAADVTAPDATAPDTDPDAGVTEPDTGVTEPVTPVVDPVTEELDGYMALVESLLSDGGFTVTTEASDRADYDVKSVITYRDMHGNTLGYTMYYNETLIPDFDDDDDDDDDDWEDRFEQEEEYAIEGIMIIDGIEYRIHGERSTETEPGESEDETEFIVYLSDTRRMVVEQSVESEQGELEREYNYIVYEGRNVIERSTFEYENEMGEIEIEMTHYKDGVSTVFFFDRELVRGEEVIRIRVGSAQSTEGYIVRLTENADGSVSYTYEKLDRYFR